MLRRARIAGFAVFFLTGATFGSWAARVPAVQERLHLSPGGLAVAVLGLEGGAIAGLPLGGALVARADSVRSLRLGFALYPPALVGAGLAPVHAALVAVLAVMAVGNSVIDVAMNAQGVELERRGRRPVLAGLHAGHSLGVLAGGLAGTVAAAAGIAPVAHFAAVATVATGGGLAATRALVREPARPGAPAFARPSRRVAALGAAAFCAFLVDGTANAWSAVDLRSEHGAAPAVAAAAFTAFSLALALGRLGTDRLVARAGRARLLRGAGLVIAAGAALVVGAPSVPLAIAGWTVVGAGVAGVAPTVFGATGNLPGTAAPAAIAAVTTVGYLGSFTGPPLIGALAGATGLSAALSLLVAAGAALLALARPRLVVGAGFERAKV